MARTFIRQDTQIRRSDVYDDTLAPSLAAYETNTVHIEDDLNTLRSKVSYLQDIQAGNWYDVQTAPSALEAGTLRGVDNVNDALHLLEKKRVLKCVWGLKSITIAGAGDTADILGAGELPGNLIAAVGTVTTLGTVCSTGDTMGTASLTEVPGPSAISPINLVQIVDAASRDPLLDGADKIYGLLQGETGLADGDTILDAVSDRVQISFVKINGTGNDLIAIASGAMDGKSYDYCYVERVRLEDLNEADFLGGANIDVPAGSTVTRKVGYDNQGVSVVNTITNATLDLGTGLSWEIGDDGSDPLLTLTENSAGSATTLAVGAAVDILDINALVNNIANGITANDAGTRPVRVGVVDGQIDTTAGDLMVKSFAELLLDDGNQGGSTWAQDGVKLSETTAEWDAYETAFGGEVSLLNAIVQASTNGARGAKVCANVTSTTAADTDVGGAAGGANLDAQLPDMSAGTFVSDYDVFVNGNLDRGGVDASANNDYYPGTSLALGQLKFEYVVKINDVICVIPYA